MLKPTPWKNRWISPDYALNLLFEKQVPNNMPWKVRIRKDGWHFIMEMKFEGKIAR